jgi:hypothetical protein
MVVSCYDDQFNAEDAEVFAKGAPGKASAFLCDFLSDLCG